MMGKSPGSGLMGAAQDSDGENTVDKLVQRANASILIGTSSWKEQFIEALTVSPVLKFMSYFPVLPTDRFLLRAKLYPMSQVPASVTPRNNEKVLE
uniref:Uncharacterized protein n=1 Tax=Timema cristinae TaxID=61476 RepID=A0A7R9CKT7_TIMCR|nr:unnamed protein product [Timema cristinae]